VRPSGIYESLFEGLPHRPVVRVGKIRMVDAELGTQLQDDLFGHANSLAQFVSRSIAGQMI
jgi:hypothetical protein